MDITHERQKILFKIDAIFNALNVFIESLLFFIIPHRCFDVNDFQNWALLEHKVMGPSLTHAEGMILGAAAKMFTIAGSVIVSGTVASAVYGVVYWLVQI